MAGDGSGNLVTTPRAIGSRRYGSLCTGIGGLDIAVEVHFGATAAWHSEIEPGPCSVIERHWPSVPNLGDLKLIDWQAVEPVEILTAGYPCQPFSSAGKRKGTDDPRHLWPFVAEAIRHLRPQVVVLENVRGHLTLGFDTVLGSLAEAGFDAEWCVLRASDVGACHQRARLWIVARNTDCASEDAHAEAGASRDRSGEPSGTPTHADRVHDDGGGTSGPAGRHEPANGGQDAPDANGRRLEERSQLDRQAASDASDGRARGGHADGLGHLAWGEYGAAIQRWEHVLGRPAPRPVDDQGRLAPPFVEWMMGYPEGWVDGLTRTQALKALGNAVVPQQALAALDELAPEAARNGAAA